MKMEMSGKSKKNSIKTKMVIPLRKRKSWGRMARKLKSNKKFIMTKMEIKLLRKKKLMNSVINYILTILLLILNRK